MFTYLKTASLWGIDADPVAVEVDMHAGLPALNIVGLADITIKEAGERIRAAVLNAGYKFPAKRITVNLAPAGERKEGSHFDLPIALGIIMSEMGRNAPTDIGVIGELSLEGSVRPVKGALALSFGMRKEGIRKIMLPAENAREVSIMKDLEIYPVGELSDAICGMVEPALLKQYIPDVSYAHFEQNSLLDFSDVVGQEYAKRAFAVAVAGNHGMLMVGPPGAGKTMLAKRLPTIMPDLGYEEMLEVTKIYSAAGRLSQEHPFLTERPFVAPHSTVTRAALLGGGMRPSPGDISLAHNGVLFLDEFGEFDNHLLNLLRKSLEDGIFAIDRQGRTSEFPCRFMFVAASNPCKCGYLGDATHECTCTHAQIESYRSKFSGPILDRIDMHIRLFPVKPEDGISIENTEGLSSGEMKQMVEQSRMRQKKRQDDVLNGQLPDRYLSKYCALNTEESEFMRQAYYKYALSMRSYIRLVKVARTIADIDGSEKIKTVHLAEALQYRTLNEFYRGNK